MPTKVDLSSIVKLVSLLQRTSGINDKKTLLKNFEDAELLKKILVYTYQSNLVFGIKEAGAKKIRAFRQSEKNLEPQKTTQRALFGVSTPKKLSLFELFDELSKHPYGSDSDLKLVAKSLEEYDDTEFELVLKILQKDLQIKCGSTTINNVFPNLIYVFDVMLAYPNAKFFNYMIGKRGLLQRKMDGYRCISSMEPDGDDVKVCMFTRNGVPLKDFVEIVDCLRHFFKVNKFKRKVYVDGEITGNSAEFSDVQKIAFREGRKTNVTYTLFDIISESEFEDNSNKHRVMTGTEGRLDYLTQAIETYLCSDKVRYQKTAIELVQTVYRGNDCDEVVSDFYAEAISKGWEGLIWKNSSAPYQRTRTKDMLKFKEEKTIDLRVIRLEEGKEGKGYESMLGSAIVSYNGYEVGVSSGFKEEERRYYWNNPNDLIGKIIEVHYQNTTENDNGTESLRLPRFIQIREDKNEPDA